jgi:hypothetical protein
MNKTKTNLRSVLGKTKVIVIVNFYIAGDEILDRLLRVSLNGKPVEEFDFQEALDHWKATKNRKI